MLEKYRATIQGDKIEWDDEVPSVVKRKRRVGVYVTLIEKQTPEKKPNGKEAAAILQKIADRGGIKSIKDPVKWQRSIRKDRILPGR